MAGGYPVGGQWTAIQSSATAGTVVLTSGAANTIGSYGQLIASTARASTWVFIALRSSITTTGSAVSGVNLAVGASGSEVVAFANLTVVRDAVASQEAGGSFYLLPFVVPAGSRIAASCQSNAVSETVRCAVTLFDDAFASHIGGGEVDTYGYNTATSIGTAVDPGSSANVKGAWAQITSGLSTDLAGFAVGLDGLAAAGGSNVFVANLDIGVGASGSEVIILPDWQFTVTLASNGRRDIGPSTIPFLPIPIPAGTRVAARVAVNIATGLTTIRQSGVTFYGVRA